MRWAERGHLAGQGEPDRRSCCLRSARTSSSPRRSRSPATTRSTPSSRTRTCSRPGSPVRIGGVDVGKVTADRPLPQHRPRAWSRCRSTTAASRSTPTRRSRSGRGCSSRATSTSTSRPARRTRRRLHNGGTIPVAHTADPVQIDQVLDALPADRPPPAPAGAPGVRRGARREADAPPRTPRQDPAVRGLTGGAGAQQDARHERRSRCATRRSCPSALTGPTGHELSRTVSGSRARQRGPGPRRTRS